MRVLHQSAGIVFKKGFESLMHIITRKRLNEFAEKHPDTKSALQFVGWTRLRLVHPTTITYPYIINI